MLVMFLKSPLSSSWFSQAPKPLRPSNPDFVLCGSLPSRPLQLQFQHLEKARYCAMRQRKLYIRKTNHFQEDFRSSTNKELSHDQLQDD